MSALAATEDNYTTFEIELRTAVMSGGLWLSIAQLPSRTKSEIEANSPCSTNVAVLRELLEVADGNARPLLMQHAQPDQLPILVCPEYAFGSSDWQEIDALVEGFPGPLVLIAGFGQCPFEGLQAIRLHAGHAGTTLRCGWQEEAEPGGRAMNFGSVWVKKPDHSREAILFGKNFLEAQAEDLNGVFKFKQLTEIVFEDLRILPFICADALETPQTGGAPTVGQRLARRAVNGHKPVLCTGSLFQPGRQASEKWIIAINRLILQFGEAQVALVISNVASASYDVRAGGDTWRNLSGVYVSKRKQLKGQKQGQESTSYFDTETVMAWPLRSTVSQVVFGTLSLPPYATDSNALHPWNASPIRARCKIGTGDGAKVQQYARSDLQDEILLISEVTGQELHGTALKLNHVREHVQAGSQDSVGSLVAYILDGPLRPEIKLRKASDICLKSREALKQCLACIDALMEGSSLDALATNKFCWAIIPSQVGEIARFGALPIPISFWWSAENSSSEMLADLRTRASSRLGGPVLRVFGRGLDGDFDPGLWQEICLDTTMATERPVAIGETEGEYDDLSTVEALSVQHAVKAQGFQSLVNLSLVRNDSPGEFEKNYDRVVRSVTI